MLQFVTSHFCIHPLTCPLLWFLRHQMSKLWFLLLKISARQLSVVALDCFRSWYEYASAHGFVSTGLELASAGCSLGWLGASYLYQAAASYTTRT